MKKYFLKLLTCFALMSIVPQIYAVTNFWQVYQQALISDPTFKAALSQEMSVAESVPQSIAVLLPQLSFTTEATLKKVQTEGNIVVAGEPVDTDNYTSVKYRMLDYQLSLTQSIFNYSYWKKLSAAKASVKSASATYNFAAQDLMSRVSKKYFAVLQAKDILMVTEAEKRALYQEYLRAKQSYEVGVKTITDVYNAKASYDDIEAQYVIAKNDVDNKLEDLRSITGVLYKDLAPLGEKLPLVTPHPSNIDEWVTKASHQNWQLIAARYTTESQRENIKVASAGHLPTLNFEAGYDNLYSKASQDGSGRSRTKTPSAAATFSLPIFSGGMVTSQTKQAIAQYELASNNEETSYRTVVNSTRKSYLGVVSGISTILANRQATISNKSSLDSIKEGYKVGTRTIIDVLNAQKQLYNSYKNYAVSRYNYLLSTVDLKQAAGTLNEEDLKIINGWLVYKVQNKLQTENNVLPKTTTLKKKKNVSSIKKAKTTQTQNEIYLQVAAYDQKNQADTMALKIQKIVSAQTKVYSAQIQGKTVYRVQIGPIDNDETISQIASELESNGFPKPMKVFKGD